jgi:MoCo/4Fe-4S cofactor protein with predicted Tat translocation signal
MFRSLAELQGTPGFKKRLEREFPQGAAELEGSGEDDSLSRRRLCA